MARYIDADMLMDFSQDIATYDYGTQKFGCFSGVSDEDIKALPTADVVEVVRCKDCKFSYEHKFFGESYCEKTNRKITQHHFCGYGKREGVE